MRGSDRSAVGRIKGCSVSLQPMRAEGPGPQQRTGDPRVDDTSVTRRVRQAVDAPLAAQGFVAAAPEQADFLVGYHVLLLDKVQGSTIRTHYGYNPSWLQRCGRLARLAAGRCVSQLFAAIRCRHPDAVHRGAGDSAADLAGLCASRDRALR